MYSLDTDQLRTFLAVEQTLSFTKAANIVSRTQSAVSMQIKKLEENIGKPLFLRLGRSIELTHDGHKLVPYAREIVEASNRARAAFDDEALRGNVYLGTADDYAERFLPAILAGFAESNPFVEVSVVCEYSGGLRQRIKSGELDVAIVTHNETLGESELIRCEPLLWVTSARHNIHQQSPLPLALGSPHCIWRESTLQALEAAGLNYRVLYTSYSATVVGAAVLAGLAVSVQPESALRPGMRVLTERDGFPPLPQCEIGLLRGRRDKSAVTEALISHIRRSLDSMSVPDYSIIDPVVSTDAMGNSSRPDRHYQDMSG
jgi:DNA-binding transcriptional LysR family regulator